MGEFIPNLGVAWALLRHREKLVGFIVKETSFHLFYWLVERNMGDSLVRNVLAIEA